MDTYYIENTHTIEAIVYIFLSRMVVENNGEHGEQRERQSKKPYISKVFSYPVFSTEREQRGTNKINGGKYMQFALDENGNRISIEKSIKGKYYKCPCCGTEVIQKKGEVMIWHFAHKSLADCVDYYDHKGEWHRAMQELFPEQNREVYEKTESYRHIFDILTDDNRVIEFQHSPLSPGDFMQRTYDYCRRANLKKSPRPIWVFDFSEKDFCLSQKNTMIAE